MARYRSSSWGESAGPRRNSLKIQTETLPAGAKKPVYAEYREHVPPDTTACIFWPKNRRKEDWRDRIEHAGPGGGAITLEMMVRESMKKEPET
jgi:hypothetical protein